MNLAIEPYEFEINHVYFAEPKQNTVIANSRFIRILYSTPCVTFTGVYVHVHLNTSAIEKHFNNATFYFDPDGSNLEIIKGIRNIEEKILQRWASESAFAQVPSRRACYNISNQLEMGQLGVWLASEINDKKSSHNLLLKISGVWENETQNEYGLTYKYI